MIEAEVMERTEERSEWLSTHMGEVALEPSSLMIVIADQQERRMLESIVAPCRWTVYLATSCEEAIRFARHTRPRVLVCDAELPDGGWRRIWKALSIGPRPPLLIVASRNADERLWAQVINAGCYDVLLKPFRREEVVWAIHCAAGQSECAVCHAKPANAS
jgi:CheY-like chemotaxis protein